MIIRSPKDNLVIDRVCNYYNVSRKCLESRTRKREIHYIRTWVWLYFLNTGRTLQRAGDVFNRDHSTVMNAVRRHNYNMLYDEYLAQYNEFMFNIFDIRTKPIIKTEENIRKEFISKLRNILLVERGLMINSTLIDKIIKQL
jgi:hypothetical protein